MMCELSEAENILWSGFSEEVILDLKLKEQVRVYHVWKEYKDILAKGTV